jgi:hypothetical protein
LRCTSCATEANISFSSELEIKEIIVSAECPKCGNSMQLNYQLVGSKNQNQNSLGSQTSLSSTTESNSNTEAFPMSSVEEVFSTTEEIPSDALKDLMED